MTSETKAQIFQTLYVSSASELIEEPRMLEMLEDWRLNNNRLGITGMMLYSGGNILQVLEGEKANIDLLMTKIMCDPRHRGIIVLLKEYLPERQFPAWSMAYKSLSTREAAGISDFFEGPKSNDEAKLIPGRAKTLLVRFKNDMT